MNMENATQGMQTPKFTTARHAFERANAAGDMLFEVRPGVSAIDALLCASSYLSAANETVYQAAEDSGNESIYSAALLTKMAKAVVDAAITGIANEEKEPS
ncbi:MAG: DUF3077 domain-containing protein [Dechloromonas sp.]|nr:DUF3077 domain-containing protein [Dechloromonas sp.]